MSQHVCRKCNCDCFTLKEFEGRKVFACMLCGSTEDMAKRVWDKPLPTEAEDDVEVKLLRLRIQWLRSWEHYANTKKESYVEQRTRYIEDYGIPPVSRDSFRSKPRRA